ncbi:MAG: hypothetical protein QOG49_850 [Frankiaceae bacterium]|nr:hypothetical protein [Frankiaceae bacterium]
MTLDIAREYCLLGLRFDRLVDGFVDAYFGDEALRREVAAEDKPDPRVLAHHAGLLRTELMSSDLPAARADFLDAQLAALEVSGRKLAGESIAFADEVEGYFQVRPEFGDQAAYADAHAALAELLPGDGPLAERYRHYREADEIRPERVKDGVLAFSSALRDIVRTSYGLPEAETIDYEIVGDKPWSGFNYYKGNFTSVVAINTDLPVRAADLPSLVAHESYPGHHTEHCRKERLLVDEGRHEEQTIFLVNTPECLIAEGLADLGLRAAVGDGWGHWATEVYADLGVRFDGERIERIGKALTPLADVRQDVVMMLHDRHATDDEAVAYLARWALVPEERARKQLAFYRDPLWRAYTSTYVEGYRLLRRWLDAGGDYRRLLDEPLTPRAILAELAA